VFGLCVAFDLRASIQFSRSIRVLFKIFRMMKTQIWIYIL
jgi:hypothetical protein